MRLTWSLSLVTRHMQVAVWFMRASGDRQDLATKQNADLSAGAYSELTDCLYWITCGCGGKI